jgi:hypothetical protein
MEPWIYFIGTAIAPFGVLALLILVRYPQWSPSTLLLAATVTPWSFAKGVTPVLVLTALLAAARLLESVVSRSHRAKGFAPPRRAAVAFGAAAIVSAVWGWLAMDPEVWAFWNPVFLPVQLGQLAALVLGPAALLLTSILLTRRVILQASIVFYLVLTTVGLLLSFVTSAFEINLRGLVLTWSASLVYGQLLFNDRLSRRVRALLIGVLLLTLYVKLVLAFSWVSGWLPTLVAIAVVTAFRSWKAVLAFATVAVLAAVLFGAFLEQDYDREYEESGSTRMEKWSLVAQQPFVRDHFFLGTGPANYALYFSAYTPRNRLSTHNNYADIFLQMGVVGLGLLLWVVVSAVRLGLRLSASGINDPFLVGFVRGVVGGVAAVIVAMMLGDWFTPFVYNQTLAGFSWTVQSWIFIGALCAVPAILLNEPDRVTHRRRATSRQPAGRQLVPAHD